MSPGHLARLFRRERGMSFGDYLRELRLRKAAELLSRTAAPVQRIAARVGYKDPSRFASHFRRRFGLTPREFRMRFGKAEMLLDFSHPDQGMPTATIDR
ncbi:MAG: helix-turn-helix transcriptional regulator [Pirellulales bacterium]|nr:helix-turn-helix transcriptional regulator [Pirellulales bacterium]